MNPLPIADLHCDLLSYLASSNKHSAMDTDEIGCALPHLNAGNVKFQVLAIFSPTMPTSSRSGLAQANHFRQLVANYPQMATDSSQLEQAGVLPSKGPTTFMVSIESGSAFSEEGENLKDSFNRYKEIEKIVGKVLYVSLTHHHENRFGGGNYTEVGLKPDGLAFLEFLHGKGTAIDLSHTSRKLAHDILNALDKHSLNVPVLASHSNYDKVWPHPRNLTDELAKGIIEKGGLIGVNFLRAFVDNDHPETLYEHILRGFSMGDGGNHMAFGADFFYTKAMNKPEREPFFYPTFSDARAYQPMFGQLLEKGLSPAQVEGLAYKNFMSFFKEKCLS